jgi:RAMP superfamily
MKQSKSKQPKPLKSFAELGGTLTGLKQEPQKPAKGEFDDQLRISREVTRPERAGRAPYNFVPLSDKPWKEVSKPPSHAVYDLALHSGILEIELLAMTEFYIRGMRALDEFIKATDTKAVQKEPFQVYGKLRLPGSSLRGLIRTMVEIICGSPMDDFINDTQLFFRTVASVADPRNTRSFEPHAATYKKRLLNQQELIVQAGYLYAGRDQWYIQPAVRDSAGRQYYRYRTPDTWVRRSVRFDVERDYASISPQGKQQGWLVCSGSIPGKKKQWVIAQEEKDPRHKVVIPYGEKSRAPDSPLPPDDVTAYKEGGISQEIEKNGFGYTDRCRGVPCFFIKWRDRQDREHVSFGHTPYFRLPYLDRAPDGIPKANSREGREMQWDMARAIFGWVPKLPGQPARRGRVIVEDGFLVSSAAEALCSKTYRTVLGQPKPTTYQHYLVQPSDQLAKIVHWDGTCSQDHPPVIRGHKLYWHRPGAEIRETEEGKADAVKTEFQPAARGALFKAKIRYDNLRLEELGALIAALELPQGCAHHLGMGKPLGLGSFQVTLTAIHPIDRKDRYRMFLDESGNLHSGDCNPGDLASKALSGFSQ